MLGIFWNIKSYIKISWPNYTLKNSRFADRHKIIEKILLEKRNRESCVEIPEKNGQSVNLNGYSEIEIETNQEIIESSINQSSIDNGAHPEVGQKEC